MIHLTIVIVYFQLKMVQLDKRQQPEKDYSNKFCFQGRTEVPKAEGTFYSKFLKAEGVTPHALPTSYAPVCFSNLILFRKKRWLLILIPHYIVSNNVNLLNL